VVVQVGVSYDSDLNHVERVTIDVANQIMREVPGGVPDFQPAVRYHTFGDSGIHFAVMLGGSDYTDQALLKHEFIKRLQ
jgi:small-conductance mechanosensitive channel